ncbi:MAG: hypothetical protein FWE21_03640 [Defluviitaleaceae bacterium]|nr:hypothetical protein [Defluviitaleaceae bacterium]
MSKHHKTKKQDHFIRNAIITFVVLAVLLTAGVLINNRHLSHAGTADGHRISTAELFFAYDANFDWFTHPVEVLNWSWYMLAEFYVVAHRGAAEFGVSLTADDIAQARENADIIRQGHITTTGEDIIAQMGFSRSAWNSFNELLILHDRVVDAIAATAVIDEDALAEAFIEYEELHGDNYIVPVVRVVEADTEEEAQELWPTIDADEVEAVNALETNMGTDNIHWAMEMTPGHISEVLPFQFGTWGFFQLVEMQHIPPDPEIWKENERIRLGHMHFLNYSELWMSQATIDRNQRAFNRIVPQDFEWQNPFGDFDFGDLNIELD